MTRSAPAVAVDSDIVLKVSAYGLAGSLWPDGAREVGVLAAARYVVSSAIERGRTRDKARAAAALASLLDGASILEPTTAELGFALELEVAAQRAKLSLDPGESQLCAIVLNRAIAALETGDKRAVRSLELLLNDIAGLAALCGRVRVLEQLLRATLTDDAVFATIARAVCAEPDVDKAVSICFGCWADSPPVEEVVARLAMYVADLRKDAPRILSAS